MVKKGNQIENLYIGESKYPFEPFYFYFFFVLLLLLCSTFSTFTVFSSLSGHNRKKSLLSCVITTAFPLVKDGARIINKPLAGWRPHSRRAFLKKGRCGGGVGGGGVGQMAKIEEQEGLAVEVTLNILNNGLSSLCSGVRSF